MDKPDTNDKNDRGEALESLLRMGHQRAEDLVSLVVAAAREHLGMEVGFLTEFVGDQEVFRRVVGAGKNFLIQEEASIPLEQMYCHLVVEGRVPSMILDTREADIVKDMAVTQQARVGCYIGVPVQLPGGRVYGTLCSVSHRPDASLTERDGRFMRVLARIVAEQLAREEEERQQRQEKIDRVQGLLEADAFSIVFQPIVELDTGRVVGMEALSRFPVEPPRTPDFWFAEAWEVGLGVELEVSALRAAFGYLDQIPSDTYLSVNVAPETLRSDALLQAVAGLPRGRLVVEVTEHAVIKEYGPVSEAIARLRGKGIRLAVDDAGAGYSGLSHILRVAPELVKLDIYLNRNIDKDLARQALAASTASFAAKMGALVLAEGVETEAEARALREAGVGYAQGYLFGRPGPLPTTSLPRGIAG